MPYYILMTTTNRIKTLRAAVQNLQDQLPEATKAEKKELNVTIARLENEMHQAIQTL